MTTTHDQLKKELRQAGANTSEAGELARIAAKLQLLKTASRAKPQGWTRVLKPAIFVIPVLALAIIIIVAHSAAPTSWLYPVQKLSDAAAITVHPQYRATVMMRRAQQVNQLVASHASAQVILATLNSYESEASDYKTAPNVNYAAFEYCKAKLEQAAATAPAEVRQAIAGSLESLKAI